jgi:hypothetical protein
MVKLSGEDFATGANAIYAALAVARGAAPAFMGFVPIPNVTKIGVVASHKAVKFRSRGPAFFAYQSGEYEGVAISVTLELSGPSKWIIYAALWDLYLIQRAQPKKVGNGGNAGKTTGISSMSSRVIGGVPTMMSSGLNLASPLNIGGTGSTPNLLTDGSTSIVAAGGSGLGPVRGPSTELSRYNASWNNELATSSGTSLTGGGGAVGVDGSPSGGGYPSFGSGIDDADIIDGDYEVISDGDEVLPASQSEGEAGQSEDDDEYVIYHVSVPFVAKDHVLLHSYIESLVEQREASTSDKIVLDLMIREFRKDIYDQALAGEGYRGGSNKISLINKWKTYALINNLVQVGSSLFEYGRVASMWRVDPSDLMWRDTINNANLFRFWGSEPLARDTINFPPKIDIHDPLQPDGSDAIDVDEWFYFDFSKKRLPTEVSIDTREFGGEKKYSIMLYMIDDTPRDSYGFYQRTQQLMCIVKDPDENITDHFRVGRGLLYRIGDGNIKICFDQIDLRYKLEINRYLGHTVTGRWDYEQ